MCAPACQVVSRRAPRVDRSSTVRRLGHPMTTLSIDLDALAPMSAGTCVAAWPHEVRCWWRRGPCCSICSSTLTPTRPRGSVSGLRTSPDDLQAIAEAVADALEERGVVAALPVVVGTNSRCDSCRRVTRSRLSVGLRRR